MKKRECRTAISSVYWIEIHCFVLSSSRVFITIYNESDVPIANLPFYSPGRRSIRALAGTVHGAHEAQYR